MNSMVSIIVPVYNVEKYLEHCINSIIHQTYPNLEIILVDDGSPDNCGDICDEFAKKDKRIKVIHKKNGGLSDARNEGLKVANGDFLAFVDSDDWVDLRLFEKVIDAFERNSVDIVCFGSYKTDGRNKTTCFTTHKEFEWTRDEALTALCKNDRIESHVWDKVYKKELFEDVFFPVGKYYEDVYIMHRIFMKANSVLFIDEPLYFYLQRNTSIVGQRTVRSGLDLMDGFQRRQVDFIGVGEDRFGELTEESIVWVALDVLRTIAVLEPNQYVSETEKLIKVLRKCKCKRFEIPYMTRAFRVDYLIAKQVPQIYFSYRKLMRRIKYASNWSPMKGCKCVYRKIRKKLEQIKNKCEPISNTLKCRPMARSIILMGAPEYNNLGDLAIAYATKKYVENNFDIPFIEVTEREIDYKLDEVKKYIRNDDVLLLQGGGNLGDVYFDQQRIRKKIISTFLHNKLILMPQTMYFSENAEGRKALTETAELFKKSPNLIMFAREQFSYEKMKNAFQNKVYMVPDIVLSLPSKRYKEKRNGVGLCIRNDKEGALNSSEFEYIISKVEKIFKEVCTIDTIAKENIHIENRESQLENVWREFSQKKLIITDRLHGVIFAVITNTPCIALANNNKKVQGICKWLESYPGVRYCDDPYEIEKYVQELMTTKCSYECNESSYLMLKQQVGEIVNG